MSLLLGLLLAIAGVAVPAAAGADEQPMQSIVETTEAIERQRSDEPSLAPAPPTTGERITNVGFALAAHHDDSDRGRAPPAPSSHNAYDIPSNFSDPAGDAGRVRRVFPGSDEGLVAPQPTSPVKAESQPRAAIGPAGNPGALPNVKPWEPNISGTVRSYVTEADEVFYRVSGPAQAEMGGFLTRARPGSPAFAREALALPPGNTGTLIQEVLVPAGTRIQRSRALAAFGRRGGAEQFELLERIPRSSFGPRSPWGS